MRKLLTIALFALLAIPATAQIATESTPDPAASFEWKLTSDGSVLAALNAWTLHEAHIDLPFGFDFNAGHTVWLGTRTRLKALTDVQGVIGYEWYLSKPLGDDWFVKGSAGLSLGPRTTDSSALTGYLGISAGKTFAP